MTQSLNIHNLWTADQWHHIHTISTYHTLCLPTCLNMLNVLMSVCWSRRWGTIHLQVLIGPTRTTGCWSARCALNWLTSMDLWSARTCICSGQRALSTSSMNRCVNRLWWELSPRPYSLNLKSMYCHVCMLEGNTITQTPALYSMQLSNTLQYYIIHWWGVWLRFV